MYEMRYSSTETYLTCQRRYLFEYVWELIPAHWVEDYEPVSIASIGSAFHAGAEALHRGEAKPERAVEAYIQEHNMMGALVKIGQTQKDAALVARECFNRYKAWVPFSDFFIDHENISLEVQLRLEIIPGVILTGIPDRVTKDRYGQGHVIDYKTVGQYSKYTPFSDKNRQGLTYALLVQKNLGIEVVDFTLLQIHRQPPKANPIPVNPLTDPFTQAQINSHEKNLVKTVNGMLALTENPELEIPHPGGHCDWCPFQDLCLAKDAEPERYAKMIHVEFKQRTKKK